MGKWKKKDAHKRGTPVVPAGDNAATQVERATKSMTPTAAWAAMRAESEKVRVYHLRRKVCVWCSMNRVLRCWAWEEMWVRVTGVIDSSQQMSPCNPSAFVPFTWPSALISPLWTVNLSAGRLSNRLTSDSGSFLDKLNLTNDKSGHAELPVPQTRSSSCAH